MTSLRKPQEPTDFSSLMSGSFPAREARPEFGKTDSGWEMRLRFSQLIILWGVLGGMMLAVFLFGLYAGREQGVRIALEERAGESIRLPLANPVAIADSGNSVSDRGDTLSGSTPAAGAAAGIRNDLSQSAGLSASGGNRPAGAGKAAEALAIDFAAQAKPASAEQAKAENAASGLAGNNALGGTGKPTIELFRDEFVAKPSGADASAEAKPEADTLAARAAAKTDTPAAGAKATAALVPATTEAAPAAKTVAPVPPTKKSGTGWYIQVAAARSKQDASQIVKKLQSTGQAARVEEARVSSGVYYRVIVGPYGNKDVATAAKKSIESSKAVKGEPFLRFIK